MLTPTRHSDILTSALRLAVSAGNNPTLKPMAINADITLLRAHMKQTLITEEDRKRAERTITQLQNNGRRYNYFYRPHKPKKKEDQQEERQ